MLSVPSKVSLPHLTTWAVGEEGRVVAGVIRDPGRWFGLGAAFHHLRAAASSGTSEGSALLLLLPLHGGGLTKPEGGEEAQREEAGGREGRIPGRVAEGGASVSGGIRRLTNLVDP